VLGSGRVGARWCGIFVGGASRRMGRPKGALVFRGEALLVRALRVAREAGLEPCLVGAAEAYEALAPDVPRLVDAVPGVGPIGGLRALASQGAQVVGLAVDMPHVDAPTLRALASQASDAQVLLPRRERYEPLLARWDGPATCRAIDALLAEGERSLQALVRALRAEVFALPAWRLDDWDTPEDVTP
jgi:molybdopterin-guanine dinucleotide biosynthesis protein A